MRRMELPPLEDDKILDAPPGLDVDTLGAKDLGTLSPRKNRTKGVQTRTKGLWILVGFLLGIGVGGLVLWELSPGKRVDLPSKVELQSRPLFAYPVAGIRLERAGSTESGPQRESSFVLRRGETIRARYGKEAVRYLALEREQSPWAWLLSLLVSVPRLYLADKPLEPGQDLLSLVAPEKSLSYELSLREKPGAPAIASFSLELEMSSDTWTARAKELKDPGEQRVCLEHALALEPGNVDLLVALGNLLWEQNDALAAAQSFEQALKLSPKNKEAASALATIYFKSKPKRALEMYVLLSEVDPRNKLNHLKRVAELQERLGKSPVETYRKILAIEKNDPDAKRGLDTLYAKQVERAQQAEKKGNLSLALREMQQAFQLHPTKEGKAYLAALNNNLAYSLAKQGKFKEAIPKYEESLKLDENPLTYLNLADAYARTKQHRNALNALEKAWAMKPKETEVVKNILLLWSEILMEQKDFRQATRKLEELHSLLPKDAQIAKMLATAYWNDKNLGKALEILKTVPPLMRSHPAKDKAEIHGMLGDLYRALGDQEKNIKARIARYDEALKEYKAALALDRANKELQKRKEQLESERMALVKRSLRP